MGFDLQGNIERFTLPEILQLVGSAKKSGTLGITRDDSIVMVYFQEGEIVYGYGPRQTYHLGQLLRENGCITEEQLEKAVRIQAHVENSRRLGEILVERRFVDRLTLTRVIQKQIEQLLYSLMSWQSGTFKFYDGEFPTQEEITVRLSVENVILEGLRRIDEQQMVAQTLPNVKAVYAIKVTEIDRKRDIALSSNEWNLLAMVDGHRSVEDICAVSSLSTENCLRTLAQLKLAGLIEKSLDKKEVSPGLDKMVNRLAGLFEEYLTQPSMATTAKGGRVTELVTE